MVKFGFYSKYTQESFKHISLVAVQQWSGERVERRDFEGWLEGGHSSRMRDDGHLHLCDAERY